MTEPARQTHLLIDWAVAVKPIAGESECGDAHFVEALPSGMIVAVLDGLGHGHQAANASRVALECMHEHLATDPLELIRRCHETLRGYRGVALTLAVIDAPSAAMTWLGVGNVDGLLLRASRHPSPVREYAPLRGGVVGEQLPPLRTATTTLRPGDLLVFTTDGIQHGYTAVIDPTDTPKSIADLILSTHGKDTDDSLVLVARYEGPP